MIFTEESRAYLRAITEKRFKDVRQHGGKAPSGAQVSKKFKMAQQALGDLESALRTSSPALAREVEHIAGLVRGVEKRIQEALEEAALTPTQIEALRVIFAQRDGDWTTVGAAPAKLPTVRVLVRLGFVGIRQDQPSTYRIGGGWGGGKTTPRTGTAPGAVYAKVTASGKAVLKKAGLI